MATRLSNNVQHMLPGRRRSKGGVMLTQGKDNGIQDLEGAIIRQLQGHVLVVPSIQPRIAHLDVLRRPHNVQLSGE